MESGMLTTNVLDPTSFLDIQETEFFNGMKEASREEKKEDKKVFYLSLRLFWVVTLARSPALSKEDKKKVPRENEEGQTKIYTQKKRESYGKNNKKRSLL